MSNYLARISALLKKLPLLSSDSHLVEVVCCLLSVSFVRSILALYCQAQFHNKSIHPIFQLHTRTTHVIKKEKLPSHMSYQCSPEVIDAYYNWLNDLNSYVNNINHYIGDVKNWFNSVQQTAADTTSTETNNTNTVIVQSQPSSNIDRQSTSIIAGAIIGGMIVFTAILCLRLWIHDHGWLRGCLKRCGWGCIGRGRDKEVNTADEELEKLPPSSYSPLDLGRAWSVDTLSEYAYRPLSEGTSQG